MIIKTFDNGWGLEFPLKQFEQEILNEFLKEKMHNQTKTVIINSVWYTQEYHQQVLSELRQLEFDDIVLISMLDCAIPSSEWFQELNCPVYSVGYYPGDNSIDCWALIIDRFYDFPRLSELADHTRIECAYMCLNRKPHWHRKRLYSQLEQLNLLDHGLVTMGGHGQAVRQLPQDCEHDDLAPNATRDQTGLPNDIGSLGLLSNWQRCFLNIVTETVFDINQHHFVSEKIYKPIVGIRPFLVYDSDGATKWLADRGFQSYVDDFQDISDLDLTDHNNIPYFLSVLSEQPVEYYRSKFVELLPKLMYNRTQFANYVHSEQDKIKKGIVCQI